MSAEVLKSFQEKIDQMFVASGASTNWRFPVAVVGKVAASVC
jgi:hypothetical protein